jgi:hypothetical protein
MAYVPASTAACQIALPNARIENGFYTKALRQLKNGFALSRRSHKIWLLPALPHPTNLLSISVLGDQWRAALRKTECRDIRNTAWMGQPCWASAGAGTTKKEGSDARRMKRQKDIFRFLPLFCICGRVGFV